jgi:M6 family metalloprotease-like protein
MKFSRLTAATITIVLISALPTVHAVKLGASCKKAGKTNVFKGKTYTCIKSGKKLVWSKSAAVAAPKPAISPTPVPSLTPTPSPIPTLSPTKTLDPKYKRQGENCPRGSADVVGYDSFGVFVTLMCNSFDDRYFPRPNATPLDQETLRPLKTSLGNLTPRIDYLTPVPISGAPNTQISPDSDLANVTECKIKDAGVYGAIPNNPQRHFVSGFPNYKERANLINNATLQFVAVDFSDLPGQRTPAEDLKPVTTFLNEFFSRQSSKKTAIEFRIPDKYIRMPKTVMEYELAVDFFSGKWKPETSFNYVREAIRVADSTIDFKGASMFAIVVPAEVTRKQIAAFVAQSGEPGQQILTAEGGIYNFLIMAGPVGTPEFELLNWAHEYGHLFGLTDVRNTVDVTRQNSADLGMLDLMNSMIAPELLAWQRFIMEILNDNQVRCVKSSKPLTHKIIPVAQPELQPKLVVIPLSEFKAIAIESRRSHGYDQNLGTLNEGVFVYTIDTTIPYRYSTMKLIPSPSAKDMEWKRDAALKVGESITLEGWKIAFVETGSFGDVIKTEKP